METGSGSRCYNSGAHTQLIRRLMTLDRAEDMIGREPVDFAKWEIVCFVGTESLKCLCISDKCYQAKEIEWFIVKPFDGLKNRSQLSEYQRHQLTQSTWVVFPLISAKICSSLERGLQSHWEGWTLEQNCCPMPEAYRENRRLRASLLETLQERNTGVRFQSVVRKKQKETLIF